MNLYYTNKKNDFIEYADFTLNMQSKSMLRILIIICMPMLIFFILSGETISSLLLPFLIPGAFLFTATLLYNRAADKKTRAQFIYRLSVCDFIYPLEGSILLKDSSLIYTSVFHDNESVEVDLKKINKVLDNKQSEKIYILDNDGTLLPIINYHYFQSEKQKEEFLKRIEPSLSKKILSCLSIKKSN